MGRRTKRFLIGMLAVLAIAVSSTSILFSLDVLPARWNPFADEPPKLPWDNTKPWQPIDPAIVLDQDRQVMAAINSGERWTALPTFVRNLDRDVSGNVWFEPPRVDKVADYTVDDFRHSVERAAHGQTRIIRGGTILFVDSHGRYWCTRERDRSQLFCYDGTKWLEPRAALVKSPSTATPPPAGSPPSPAQRAADMWQFSQSALEHSDGNIYFVARGLKMYDIGGLHRFAADGTWSFFPFPGTEYDQTHVSENPLMLEQAGGQIALYPPPGEPLGKDGVTNNGVLKRDGKPPVARELTRVPIFDGQSWTIFQPLDVPDEKMWVRYVVAFPDGSIVTFYEDPSELWDSVSPVTVRWPSESNERLAGRVRGIVKDLDNPDPETRRAALQGLVSLGPPIARQIETLIQSGGSPERRSGLKAISARLEQMAREQEQPSMEVLAAGRYALQNVNYLARTVDGKVRIGAEKCEDRGLHQVFGPTYLTVSREGKWTMTPLPERISSFYSQTNPFLIYEDVTGSLWIENVRLDPDLKVHSATPPGFAIKEILGSDRDGRVYFSTAGGPYMFDRRVPQPEPGLPMKISFSRGLHVSSDQRTAWCSNDIPERILPDGTIDLVPPPSGLAAYAMFPLRDKAALIWLTSPEDKSKREINPRLWDGHKWSDSDPSSARDYFHKHASELVPHLPNGLMRYDRVDDPWSLSGAGGIGIWLKSQTRSWKGPEPHQDKDAEIRQFLEYFDGATWHDVWELFPDLAENSRECHVIGVIENGRTLLMLPKGSLQVFGIWWEDGSLHKRTITETFKSPFPTLIQSPDGSKAWFWWVGRKTVRELSADSAKEVKWLGTPMYADSANRLWSFGQREIFVQSGSMSASLPVAELRDYSGMIESSDRRIWLLNTDGLVQLQVDETPQSLKIVEVGRWKWNWPRNDFDPLFCDEAGGLWIGGTEGAVWRYTLPNAGKSPETATQPSTLPAP